MPLADYIRSAPFRLAAAYAALFAVSVTALFGVVYWLTTDEMEQQLRRRIEQDAGALLAVYRARGLEALKDAIEDRMADMQDRDILYVLQDVSGHLLAGNSASTQPFLGWRTWRPGQRSAPYPDGNGQAWFLSRGIDVDTAFLLVARSLHGVREVQEVLLRSLVWTMGLTLFLALAGGVVLARGTLRRVTAINRAAREIVEGNLSRRIPIQGTRDELDSLAANINYMLDRIEHLMANLQQVTNDIAHDLRTPLGRLRQRLEMARLKAYTPAEHQMVLDHAIAETDAILETFAALLRIAQIESRTRRARFVDVDLSDLANRIIEVYETVAEDEGQSFRGHITPAVQVRGDKDLLMQMLANLVENAIRHCPQRTNITVAVCRHGAHAVLTVADTGPGIPAPDRDKVLHRFYRLEKSRTTPGSGLGLVLVKAVADLHDASLELLDNTPGLRVTLRFSSGNGH
jgi:signal transduction histidine kinase